VQQKLCNSTDIGSWITSSDGESIQKQTLNFPNDGPLPKTLTYPVKKKGYYCVGASERWCSGIVCPRRAFPLTSHRALQPAAVPMTSDTVHAAFNAQIAFRNTFKGSLPAAEFPKLGFYFALTTVYCVLGAVWLFLSMKHRQE
jgi:Lung seven transmembrane receptor